MTKFINFKFDSGLPKKLLLKHCLFSLFWVFGIAIFVFRVDTSIFSVFHIQNFEINYFVPVLFIFLLFFLIKNQKWYYTIAFVFYPFLLIFWFLPKWILVKGKIYIFLYYLNFIVQLIIKFKHAIFIFFIGVCTLTLLLLTSSIWVKIFSIFFFSYVYYLFLKIFIRDFFKPAQLLEPKSINILEKYISETDTDNSTLIKDLENQKEDEKLNENEKLHKRKIRLIRVNYFLEYLSQSLSGFRNERSYLKFCIFQLSLYFIITLSYFSFFNYELFKINNNNFIYLNNPTGFDFFYYTIKTITFGSIDSLKPNSVIAKIIEISSFLIMGVFLLIIVVSQLFSLKQQKFKKEIKMGIDACQSQSKLITKHLEVKYSIDINSAHTEVNSDQFIKDMKKILEQIF